MKYRLVLNLIRNYRWRSFFVRYFILTFLPFLLLFTIVAGVLYNNHINRTWDEAQRTALNGLTNVRYLMENVFREVNNSYHSILASEDIQSFLATTRTEDLEYARTVRNLQRYMVSVVNANPSLQSIYLYGLKGDYVLSSASQFVSARRIPLAIWHG